MEEIKRKVREAPRVSLNALSEYLVAPAATRRRIVQEQKRPKAFQVAYYTEIEETISHYLASKNREVSSLGLDFRTVQKSSKSPDWELSRREAATEALEAFRKLTPDLPIDDLEVRRGPSKARTLEIAGVTVSVRPEAILVAGSGSEEAQIGAMKLYFSKNKPIGEERARYAGTVLHQFLEEYYSHLGVPDYRSCLVVDIFAGKLFAAPRTYKRRRQDIEAACLEIGLMWPQA